MVPKTEDVSKRQMVKGLHCRVQRSGLYPKSYERLLKQGCVGRVESKPRAESSLSHAQAGSTKMRRCLAGRRCEQHCRGPSSCEDLGT